MMTTIDRDPRFAIWLNRKIRETRELLNQQECLHRNLERIFGKDGTAYVKECGKNIATLTGELEAYLEVWKHCYQVEWEDSDND